MRTLGAVSSYTWVAVGETAGDGDLGGFVLAGGSVWDDVVGRPLVVNGFSCRVEFGWGLELFGAGRFSWAFACGAPLISTRYCGLQVSGAPTWAAAAVAAWKRAVVLGVREGVAG